MKKYPLEYKPYGAHAMLITWPDVIEESILFNILKFARILKALPEFSSGWEVVTAYNSLTLINNKEIIDATLLKRKLRHWYEEVDDPGPFKRTLWKLPVCYDEDFGLDLHELSALWKISREKIVELHTGAVYTVYGIGFLPGFMYLGGLPETLESPRKQSPRLKVPKGAVGLAGKQTGIYPQDSPGGWNIIGNCPIPLFNPRREIPCFVNVGDKVQFVAVSRAVYEVHKIEAEVDIYSLEKIALND